MAKLITVFGATGKQGNSVALALLADAGFKVRALTRNPDSNGSKTLKDKGCEVVKVDMDDKESLKKAIAGSYGVFAVTNYWGLLQDSQDPKIAEDHEIAQGKNIGDVCLDEGVKHLVYSGVEHAQEITGKPTPHFDSKGIVEKYLDEIKVPNTSTRVSFYYENFITYPPEKKEDGTYTVTWCMDGEIDTVSVNDLGPAVVSILNSPDKYLGKKIGLGGDKMTFHEYTAILSEVSGKTYKYNQVPAEVFAKFPFLGAEDLANMFYYYEVGNPDRDRDLTRTLNPAVVKFKEWAEKNKDKF